MDLKHKLALIEATNKLHGSIAVLTVMAAPRMPEMLKASRVAVVTGKGVGSWVDVRRLADWFIEQEPDACREVLARALAFDMAFQCGIGPTDDLPAGGVEVPDVE